ncbi:hypothetical protein F441_03695 [Phytophthora nicotianae CJ01A1]|uniref:Uncharacterized protein n=4 Tax=Phytophthora nicotianae TaxID=4792 RepID=W2ZXX3_PHYNI|nr:hypothetical protein L917_03457 [Phytophthora nicotianae]ETO82005.1 hypothetical protein F444_03771 [Phytophthora nicotianae P1976]ETP23117.1 hypothetical protein F441_03695 [Phytophthora nicotianae CJ01A1]ETP51124.1 hypothetical protein F442_03678 [Phytophthora nicotianae P10297]
MAASSSNLHNRTNNPLENYNRAFGDRFSVKHPSLLSFVKIAKDGAGRYVRLIEDVKHKRREPTAHAPEVEPRIPLEFNEFE